MKTINTLPAGARRSPRGKAWCVKWLLALGIACGGISSSPVAFAEPPRGFSPDDIIVKPLPGVDLPALNRAIGLRVRRSFPAVGHLAIVPVPPGVTADELIGMYQNKHLVEYAEHDFYVHALATPNDPGYTDGEQWSLRNTGQNGGKPGADIHAWEAWNYATSAANIIVGVVDTGIRYTHQDLAANMWVNPADGSHGINVVANARAPNDPWDDYGHGSHVSGIIGAVTDNSVGIAGICWQVQLMGCKFLDSSGNGTISGAITCLDYVRDHGAKVVNASWGSFTFTSQALHDAIASLRDADIIFVAAAGNSAVNNDVTPLYPASYSDLDNVVSVAATDDRDRLTSWSDYGATSVDLAAPGENIVSCWNASDQDYADDQGTSQACAEVTGTCALLRASYPGENHLQIIQRILNNTDPETSLRHKCKTGGRLDLYKALEVSSSSLSLLPLSTTSMNTGLGI